MKELSTLTGKKQCILRGIKKFVSDGMMSGMTAQGTEVWPHLINVYKKCNK